ncbi:DUF3560 domain-containing protein [Joostella sp.]|uniref:DUF3560 domain-containing protein n=1 Tax=Joostella sp. TaxID=2231138 RepID=UPI003A8DB9EE
MNTYKKYCPNVFVAKCPESHEKGEVITLTTRYGKENESVIHNLVGRDKDGSYYYSITRLDGFDAKERAIKRAEKLKSYAANAESRSNEAYDSRATKSELEFMKLGEPIKIGHHSEKRHRKLFEKYDSKMRKSFEEREKAENYINRATYWESKSNDINLSMPESLEYYEYLLEKAKQRHEGMKNGTIERDHSYSLTYAKKEVNEITKKLDVAKKLWS